MNSEENASSSYSRIPNHALDWLLGPENGLSYRERHVLHAVFRFTYGFNRRSAPLSSRYLSEYTGIDQAHVCRALKSLVDAGFLHVSHERRIGFYSLCPRKYKNKRSLEDSYADDASGASRCSSGIVDDAPPASKIKRKKEAKHVQPPSSLEVRFASLLRENGLPPGEREYPLGQWRLDFAWPVEKVAVEIDGGVYSGGSHVTGEGHDRDCAKANFALLNGWTLYRLTSTMLCKGGGFEAVLDALRQRGVTATEKALAQSTATGSVFDQSLPDSLFDQVI